MLPYVEPMKQRNKNESVVQEAITWHLARLEAVKQNLTPAFHEALLDELCDFIAPEERLTAWQN